jgi:hypothetical protein
MQIHDLRMEVSNHPGAGSRAWSLSVYLNALGYTNQSCVITSGNTVCNERLAALGYLSGNSPQTGDTIVLEIVPFPLTAADPVATDMWISGCASESPP